MELVKRREAGAADHDALAGDVRVVDHVFHRDGRPLGDFQAGVAHGVRRGRAVPRREGRGWHRDHEA